MQLVALFTNVRAAVSPTKAPLLVCHHRALMTTYQQLARTQKEGKTTKGKYTRRAQLSFQLTNFQLG